MDLITTEIQKATEVLNFKESDIRLLASGESRPLYFDLLKTFVHGKDRRWWWEDFVEKAESFQPNENNGYLRIPSLVPDPLEVVWFVVEECSLDHYPIYETTPSVATKVIGECYGFEYYLIPKDRRWLLCENHHNRLIGLGDSVVQKLKASTQ